MKAESDAGAHTLRKYNPWKQSVELRRPNPGKPITDSLPLGAE
jgi:hypothetical protein